MPKGFFPEITQSTDGLLGVAPIDWEGFIKHYRNALLLPFLEQTTRDDLFTLSPGPSAFPTKAFEKNEHPL